MSEADDSAAEARADQLMRRHAQGAAKPPVESDGIPTLTDLVRPGTGKRPPPLPAAIDSAGVTPAQAQALENEVYQRLQSRLDREIGAVLERKVMPELSGSLDHALEHLAAELKGSVRQMVREAIEETLSQRVRNRQLPLEDAEGGDTPPDIR